MTGKKETKDSPKRSKQDPETKIHGHTKINIEGLLRKSILDGDIEINGKIWILEKTDYLDEVERIPMTDDIGKEKLDKHRNLHFTRKYLSYITLETK